MKDIQTSVELGIVRKQGDSAGKYWFHSETAFS